MSQGNIRRDDGNEPLPNEERQNHADPQSQALIDERGRIRVQYYYMSERTLRIFCSFCEIVAEESPQRAECIEDDDYFLRNRDCVDTFRDCANLNLPHKWRLLANVASQECISGPGKQDLFEKLPDELLLNVFRYLPRACDRSSCASVCRRCLKLQSHMQRKDFYMEERQCNLTTCSDHKKDELVDEGHSPEAQPGFVEDVSVNVRVERQPQWAIGDLSRSLEGKEATDLRLAAIAVGTGGQGGLGKLCIKGGGLARVSDEGLLAIGYSCAALQSLVLWDCPKITNKSIAVIGEGCRLLQKFEALKCPLIGDAGVSSIAKNAIFLSILSFDECPLIGETALYSVSECCRELTHLDIRNCPLVGDDGLKAVLQNCRKLQSLKLQGLQVSDGVLMPVNLHGRALLTLGLSSLNAVTEHGFLSFCNVSSVKGLRRLAITNCTSFNNATVAAVGNRFKNLKYISLTRCERISDSGLTELVRISSSLEILHVERCKKITGVSLISAVGSKTGSLKEIHFKSCDGIQDRKLSLPPLVFPRGISALKSLCLTDCGGVGDICLLRVACLCSHQLRDLDLTGLTHVTDAGILAIVKRGGCTLASVNVTGCDKLTDFSVRVIAKQCGRSLRSFVLDGCRKVTDVGLEAIGKHCVVLEDLHISQCGITDEGVQGFNTTAGSALMWRCHKSNFRLY